MQQPDLERRISEERTFHEKKFGERLLGGAQKPDYYEAGFTRPVVQQMLSRLGDVSGKQILEYGCGEGWVSRNLARRGAVVSAFDISHNALLLAKGKSHDVAPGRVEYVQMAAEHLGFRENTFDFVIGSAILHHLDLERAVSEIHRVLRKGGVAVFAEPLGHNPLLNLYRRLTPGKRSRDERPLRVESFRVFERFERFEHQEYFLTAILALPLNALGRNHAMVWLRDRLQRLDRALLKWRPKCYKYCWYSLMVLTK